jgi:L-fuconate dehydratase
MSFFDYVAVSGSLSGRMIEYVDHLHEHFVDPTVISSGRYVAPRAPGFSSQMHSDSLARFRFPSGEAWAS